MAAPGIVFCSKKLVRVERCSSNIGVVSQLMHTPMCSSNPPGKSTSFLASIASSMVMTFFLIKSLQRHPEHALRAVYNYYEAMKILKTLPCG